MRAGSRGCILQVAAAIALVAQSAGCGSHLHAHRGLPGTAIAWESAVPTTSPLVLPSGLRGVVIGRMDFPTATAAAPAEAPDEAISVPIQADALRRGLRDALQQSGACPEVRLAEEAHDPRGDGTPLVIDTRLTRAVLRRASHEDSMGAVFATWWLIGFGSTFVHDRAYELKLEPTFTVRDGRSAKPLVEVRTRSGEIRDALSFHERRSGGGAYAAAFFGVPSFAIDSTPADLAASLAPAAWRVPAGDLVARLRSLRSRFRVGEPRAQPQSVASVRLLEPSPGTLIEGPEVEVRVRVALRPEIRQRLRAVTIGGHDEAGAGRVFDRRVRIRVDGKPIVVRAALEDGAPIPVLEIPILEEPTLAPVSEDRKP